MRHILIALLLFVAIVMEGQGVIHDYLIIKITPYGSIMISSTDGELRDLPLPKGEKSDVSLSVRVDHVLYAVVFEEIQKHEAQGWTLFDLDENRWIMRKPKE